MTGFLLVAFSVITARQNPVTSYEHSIYTGTPIEIWGALTLALFISLISIYTRNELPGMALGYLAILTWTSMRIIRGYHFVGADPLVHLGHTKTLIAGGDPMDFFYPFTHLFATCISYVLGLDARLALLITTPIFTLLFLISIPVLIARFSERDKDTSYRIGASIAMLLLPINHLSVFLQPHPSSYAILILPLVLFVVFYAFQQRTRETQTVILIIASATFALHPLMAVFLILILSTFAVTDYVLGRRYRPDFISEPHVVAASTAIFLAVITVFHLLQQDIAQNAILRIVAQLANPELQGQTTTDQASTLTEIGFSPLQIALRITAVPLIISGVAAIGGLRSLYRYYQETASQSDWFILLISAATIPVGLSLAVFFAAGIRLHFRVLGILVTLASIVAGIYLTHSLADAGRIYARIPASTAFGVLFAILLVATLPVLLPSPFILQSSGHVTEAEMATAAQADEMGVGPRVVEIRSDYPRLVYGATGNQAPQFTVLAPDNFNNQSLPNAYDSDRHLLVTTSDYEHDVEMYNEYRYSQDDFEYLDREPGLQLVIDSGDARIYKLNAE